MENFIVVSALQNILYDLKCDSSCVKRIKTILEFITDEEVKEIFLKWIDFYESMLSYDIDNNQEIKGILRESTNYWNSGMKSKHKVIHHLFFNILHSKFGIVLLDNTYKKIIGHN